MYVCRYVCTYVCMYVYECRHIHPHVYVYTVMLDIRMYVYVSTHTHAYACMHVYVLNVHIMYTQYVNTYLPMFPLIFFARLIILHSNYFALCVRDSVAC